MLFVLVCAATYASAGVVRMGDTGLYHAHCVKWLVEYGLVPGLANLHYRLGYNSAWFAFAALFDGAGLNDKAFAFVNLLPLFIASVYFCSGLHLVFFQRLLAVSSLMKLGFVLPILQYSLFIPSLSPDYINTVWVFSSLVLLAELLDAKHMPSCR